jgi:hypothetical protein
MFLDNGSVDVDPIGSTLEQGKWDRHSLQGIGERCRTVS